MKKKVGLVAKRDPRVEEHARLFEQWLTRKGAAVVRRPAAEPSRTGRPAPLPEIPADTFCVFVLGGDGTFLSAVRWIGDRRIPVVGVKFGEVGFLAEIAEERLYPVAETILAEHFSTQSRMRLVCSIEREGRLLGRETVLNDIVINKGALARLSNIETAIDDHYITTYRADGLIVATPTGSTAYSLAAGGPVVHPSVAGIVMTPICPFTLTNRPLIIPDDSTVEIRLGAESSDIIITFDGQSGYEIDARDTIRIRKSPHSVEMITVPDHNYYDLLKAKLRWSGGRV